MGGWSRGQRGLLGILSGYGVGFLVGLMGLEEGRRGDLNVCLLCLLLLSGDRKADVV